MNIHLKREIVELFLDTKEYFNLSYLEAFKLVMPKADPKYAYPPVGGWESFEKELNKFMAECYKRAEAKHSR